MILKNKIVSLSILAMVLLLQACHIYSFTGANIEGKTINVYFIENNANLVAPALSNTLTLAVRNKIINQTQLSQVNNSKVDYIIKGSITDYAVTIGSIQNAQSVATNRLTVTASFEFVNNVDPKKSFTRTFSKFGDFDGAKTLQQAEPVLIEQISKEIADVLFNDAFVNW